MATKVTKIITLSNEQANAPCLRFYSQQDALNFTSQCVENSNRWLVANEFDFIESYRNGQSEIVVKIFSMGIGGEYYDLVLDAIPPGGIGDAKKPGCPKPCSGPGSDTDHGNQQPMFVGVTQIIKSVKEIIPSFVRLECSKELMDGTRNIFGPSSERFSEFGKTPGERESGFAGIYLSGGNSRRMTSVVKSGPEVIDGIGSNLIKIWQRLSEPDFVKLVFGAVDIRLSKLFVGAFFTEVSEITFEIINVFLRARELAPRTS